MINRIWDPKNLFTGAVLKEYSSWVLELSYNQHTLGSYILFCKRSIEKTSELATDELENLRFAMHEIEKTLTSIETFKPDRFNYMQLGNQLHHLHFHGIPRYNSPRFFGGKEWIDPNPRTLPVWSHTYADKSLIEMLRNSIVPYMRCNHK